MVFGSYAQYYDTIYKTKKYGKECAYVEQLFKKHAQSQVKTILDLGCGTANHMIPLITRGYKVTGVDASARMLKLAQRKLGSLDLKAELFREKLQSFQLDSKFDAVLCLFSVIDYVTRKKDLLATFDNIVRHMKRTSVFIFDFWQKSAVEGYYSPRKKNLFKVNGKVLKRGSTTHIDPSKRLCEVNYTCSLTQSGRLAQRDQEKHTLRYFAIDEMEEYLRQAGLNVIDVHPFMKRTSKIKKNTWDVTMVARKL